MAHPTNVPGRAQGFGIYSSVPGGDQIFTKVEIVGVWFISAADIAAIWQGPKRSGAKWRRSRNRAQRSEGTCLVRIIQVRTGFCRGAAFPAERTWARL